MSLICKIFGHKYIAGTTDLEGMCEVICSRCSSKARWPRAMLCKRGDHDWKPTGAQQYDIISYRNEKKIGAKTRRAWRCRHCEAIKQDTEDEMPYGTWFIVDGKFIHEHEVDKRRFKITEKKA